MSPTRDKSGAPAYCFSYILIKEHNSYNISVFSLLISHISLLFISNLVKLKQLLSIMDISLCRSFFKLLQLKRKCMNFIFNFSPGAPGTHSIMSWDTHVSTLWDTLYYVMGYPCIYLFQQLIDVQTTSILSGSFSNYNFEQCLNIFHNQSQL